MKKTILIPLLFIRVCLLGQIGNSSCNYPIPLCAESDVPITFNQVSQVCTNGKIKMYFVFQSDHTCTTDGQGALNAFGYDVMDINSNYFTISSNYRIFGPFNKGTGYCDLIQSVQAPILQEDNQIVGPHFFNANLIEDKVYYVEVLIDACEGFIRFNTSAGSIYKCSPEIECENCIPKFQPNFGKYVVSAWARENSSLGVTLQKLTFDQPQIDILAGGAIQSFSPSGMIIDGWQKIEGVFTVTDNTSFELRLKSNGANQVLFDDIRIFPNDGSAISYTYDPLSRRLMAELDERNYATLYEYDEEGKLVRIKKETEKGVMTIQENRENNSIKP